MELTSTHGPCNRVLALMGCSWLCYVYILFSSWYASGPPAHGTRNFIFLSTLRLAPQIPITALCKSMRSEIQGASGIVVEVGRGRSHVTGLPTRC